MEATHCWMVADPDSCFLTSDHCFLLYPLPSLFLLPSRAVAHLRLLPTRVSEWLGLHPGTILPAFSWAFPLLFLGSYFSFCS